MWRAIAGFRLVTADLPRLAAFYRDVLGFAAEGDARRIAAGRRQTLRLGDQRLDIDQYDAPGRPHPGGDAAALWFQHFAIVVDDMADAFTRVREAAAISQGGPQTLPASSGGVVAYKFRDPDLHPLELLQFPPGAAPAPWRGRRATGWQIGLGIDHSAISVRDAAASMAFYRSHGLSPGDRTLNHGPAQQRLDGLLPLLVGEGRGEGLAASAGVEVEVIPMRAAEDPAHLELLAYRSPRGARGPTLEPADIAATRIVWRGDAPGLVRDPDGHLHEVVA